MKPLLMHTGGIFLRMTANYCVLMIGNGIMKKRLGDDADRKKEQQQGRKYFLYGVGWSQVSLAGINAHKSRGKKMKSTILRWISDYCTRLIFCGCVHAKKQNRKEHQCFSLRTVVLVFQNSATGILRIDKRFRNAMLWQAPSYSFYQVTRRCRSGASCFFIRTINRLKLQVVSISGRCQVSKKISHNGFIAIVMKRFFKVFCEVGRGRG